MPSAGCEGLRRSLGTPQVFALSIAVVSPTMAVGFNVALTARVAGGAAPLSFLLGATLVGLVGLSFIAFGRRIASAGSVAAFVEAAFGPRWGFLAGWTLLLTYAAFLTLTSALAGDFLAAALAHFGLRVPGPWLALAAAGMAIAFGSREIRRLTQIMLVIEGASVFGVFVLAAVILARTPWSIVPFRPDAGHGWSGVGYGITFAVLSFAGFEGVATAGEEARDPHRTIPTAIVGAVATLSLVYVVASYAQVLGFGLDHVADLARSDAPLDALAGRYVSAGFGAALDLAVAASALGGTLGAMAAGARILYALGRDGLRGSLGLGRIDARHGVPGRAVWLLGGSNVVSLLGLASWAGAHDYADAASTVGALAVLLVYLGVCAAQASTAGSAGRPLWSALGVAVPAPRPAGRGSACPAAAHAKENGIDERRDQP